MESNVNNKIIKPCLSSHNSIITESTKEQFKKRIKENIEKANRISALINENKELYFQSEWVVELNIDNKGIALQSEGNAECASELISANKELALPSYK